MPKIALQSSPEPLPSERTPVDLGRFEIRTCAPDHHALHAGRAFVAREALREFSALAQIERPTRHSVQVSETEHILLNPAFLQYINHSCSPNVALDVARWELVALRSIEAGEELRYFYPSTEWLMTCPFLCSCKQRGCLGQIRGAAFLPPALANAIPLAAHIQRLLAHERTLTTRPASTP